MTARLRFVLDTDSPTGPPAPEASRRSTILGRRVVPRWRDGWSPGCRRHRRSATLAAMADLPAATLTSASAAFRFGTGDDPAQW